MSLLRSMMIVIFLLAQAGIAREWTDSTGKFKVEAELVRVKGDTVYLKRHSDGATIPVPLVRLSTPDQAYLQSQQNQDVGKQTTTGDVVSDMRMTASENKLDKGTPAPAFATVLWPLYQEQLQRTEITDQSTKNALLEHACATALGLGLGDVAGAQFDQMAGSTSDARPGGRRYIQMAATIAQSVPERSRELCRKACEAALQGNQDNASRILRILPLQLEAGFAADAHEFAKRIKDPELRCRALLITSDAVLHQAGKEQTSSAWQEVKETISEISDASLKQRLEAELERATRLSVPFSPAALDELAASWRDGKEKPDVTIVLLLDYIDVLKRRCDEAAVNTTLQYIEDHLLPEIAGNTPQNSYSPSPSGSGAWPRLLSTCHQAHQFDRSVRLIAAMDLENEQQLAFAASNLSRLTSGGPSVQQDPLGDVPRKSLQEFLRLCEKVAESLAPGHEKCGLLGTILDANRALGDEAGIQQALQPYLAAAKSPSSWKRGVSDIARNLAKSGEVSALQALHDDTEDESTREFLKVQIVKAMVRQGRNDEALQLTRAITDPSSRAEALGVVAASLYSREGKDRTLEFVRHELASTNADSPDGDEARVEEPTRSLELVARLIASGSQYLMSARS